MFGKFRPALIESKTMFTDKILNQKKYFLWDFDGCFCDTETVHWMAYNLAFKPYGHSIEKKEYFYHFTHLGQGVQDEITRAGLSCDPILVRQEKVKNYWTLIQEGAASPFLEMKSILENIENAGKLIAIVSNSPQEEIELILQKQDLLPYVDFILGQTEGLRKKPFPDLYLEAHRRIGGEKSDYIVFEDSERGLAAAHGAGLEGVWVTTLDNQHLPTTSPHLFACSHRELLEKLAHVDG